MAESRGGSFRGMQGRKAQERQESHVIQRQLRPETSSLDPSHVAERGLKLQSPSVYKDMPEAPNSLVWTGGISPIAGRDVGAEVLQENLVTVLPWCSPSGEAHLDDLPPLYLQVPVDEPVGFKVIIILPKRVDELLGHLHVESTQRRSPLSSLPPSLQGEVRPAVP